MQPHIFELSGEVRSISEKDYCFSVFILTVFPSVITSIAPFLSVRSVLILFSCSNPSVDFVGWPYLLCAPTEMTARDGVSLCKISSLVPVFEPW